MICLGDWYSRHASSAWHAKQSLCGSGLTVRRWYSIDPGASGAPAGKLGKVK